MSRYNGSVHCTQWGRFINTVLNADIIKLDQTGIGCAICITVVYAGLAYLARPFILMSPLDLHTVHQYFAP